ncbi:MAG: stage II sporulation protein D [Planctomycetota bacterium]|jgi:stage II sporulation protein D
MKPPPTYSLTKLHAQLFLLGVIGLAGCRPPAWSQVDSSQNRVVDASFTPGSTSGRKRAIPVAPLPPMGSVAARLEGFERTNSIHVVTGNVDFRIERSGNQVTCSDGRRGDWILIEPEGTRGLHVGEKLYRGSMLILPHSSNGISVINHVPMEDYVRGVVAKELAIWSAPPALLEAQAIAARSYAQAQLRGRPGKSARVVLSDSILDQAYGGEYQPGSGAGAQKADKRLRQAVKATRDLVLVVNGRVLDSRFHATCGGRTASFESVFSETDPGGMAPVECPGCRDADPTSSVHWDWTADSNALRSLAQDLGLGSQIQRVFPIRRDDVGRWLEVRVVGDRGGRNVDSTRLRQKLGYTNLKSTWITGTAPTPGRPIDGQIRFQGRGRGHGVGFCQTGARVLADQGWNSRQILGKYFPLAGLSRLSSRAHPSTSSSRSSR